MPTTTSKNTGHKKNGTPAKTSVKKAPGSSQKKNAEENQEELFKLFEHALRDMYWVEKTLTRSIPKMIKKAQAEELVSALEDHLDATEDQVSKLESVFEGIGKAARGKKCVAMEGILKEGEELMEEFDGPILDSAIIMAAQKVEHYEISAYNSMITLARLLDFVKEADILQEVLDQEMEADKLLTNLAINTSHKEMVEA